MGALTFNWFGRRDDAAMAPMPLIASRDLPAAGLALPRSPEPMPDEALIFAQSAARRAADADEGAAAVPAMATGADLRAMLERFERASRRKQALDNAVQARARIVERLAAGKTGMRPALHLVGSGRATAAAEERRIDAAMDEALASALVTLKRLSGSNRD